MWIWLKEDNDTDIDGRDGLRLINVTEGNLTDGNLTDGNTTNLIVPISQAE